MKQNGSTWMEEEEEEPHWSLAEDHSDSKCLLTRAMVRAGGPGVWGNSDRFGETRACPQGMFCLRRGQQV